jgi:tripartite-type tricarboxylate transporter receptor subunit TctC
MVAKQFCEGRIMAMRGLNLNAWLAALLAAPCIALAQGYPNKPVRLIVPYPPGGSSDLVGRLIGVRLSTALGQPVVVENRTGGDAMIGTAAVARAAPDGYTILCTTGATHTQVQFLHKEVPYDPYNDFSPITIAVTQTSFVLVHPSAGINTFKELIDYAKRNPGKLSYGTSGTGSNFHLAGVVIKQMTGIDMVHIPYKGGGPIMQAIVSGEVPIAIFSNTSATPALKSGKIKALVVVDNKRLKAWPNVPAITEFLPGFDKPGEWIAFYGPAKLPEPIIDRLHFEIVNALKIPDVIEKLDAVGMLPLGNTPREFAAVIKHDAALNGKLFQAAGVKPE